MNTPLIAVIIVITLIVGSTLSIMNKACKSGHHAWCAPMWSIVWYAILAALSGVISVLITPFIKPAAKPV
jgi:hypothetical protein